MREQNYAENAIFASVVPAVGAAAPVAGDQARRVPGVRLFRRLEETSGSTRDRRRTLERIADQPGGLGLELSFSVEASADLGQIVPSLRAGSFHNAMYDSMGLAGKAATAERMLARPGRRDQRGTDRDREHRAAG